MSEILYKRGYSTENRIINNSIILGILICTNIITSLLNSVNNIFPIIIILLVSIHIYNTIKFTNKIRININIINLNIIIIVQFIFALLYINNDATISFLGCYLSIGISSMLIANNQIDISIILKTIQVIGLISLSYIVKFIFKEYTVYEAGMLMGAAYAILPIILSSITILFFLNNINRIWKITAVVNLLVCIFASKSFMSRGYFICILFFIIMMILKTTRGNIKNKIKVLSIFILLIFIYSTFIHKYISDTSWYNLIFVHKSANILNGREHDIEIILKSRNLLEILFGSGIGSFYEVSGELYIHNLIGMVFYEQGLLLAIPLILLIINAFKRFFYSKNYSYSILILLLLSLSIVRLMLSYYFWVDQIFWIFLKFSIIKEFKCSKGGENFV